MIDTYSIALQLAEQGLSREEAIERLKSETSEKDFAIESNVRFAFMKYDLANRIDEPAEPIVPPPPPPPPPPESSSHSEPTIEHVDAHQQFQQDWQAACKKREVAYAQAEAERQTREREEQLAARMRYGLPCAQLSHLILPADANHLLFATALHDIVGDFFNKTSSLRPRCLDVLLACYAEWNRMGCAATNGSYSIVTTIAQLTRQLGYSSAGGVQHRYVKDALDRMMQANLLTWRRIPDQKKGVIIELATKLSPLTMNKLKPLDFNQFRAVRAPTKKFVLLQASRQVANPSNKGELKDATLAEKLGINWSDKKKRSRLDDIQQALDKARLDDTHLLCVILTETAAKNGLKLVFKRQRIDGKPAAPPRPTKSTKQQTRSPNRKKSSGTFTPVSSVIGAYPTA